MYFPEWSFDMYQIYHIWQLFCKIECIRSVNHCSLKLSSGGEGGASEGALSVEEASRLLHTMQASLRERLLLQRRVLDEILTRSKNLTDVHSLVYCFCKSSQPLHFNKILIWNFGFIKIHQISLNLNTIKQPIVT